MPPSTVAAGAGGDSRPAPPPALPSWEVVVEGGRTATGLDALELAQKIADAEAAILRHRSMQFIVANFEEVAGTPRFQSLVGSAVYYSIIAAVYQVVKAAL